MYFHQSALIASGFCNNSNQQISLSTSTEGVVKAVSSSLSSNYRNNEDCVWGFSGSTRSVVYSLYYSAAQGDTVNIFVSMYFFLYFAKLQTP